MKHKLNVYRIKFTTPLHLGDEKQDYSQSLRVLHSDSMYAALTAALFKLGYNPPPDFNGDLGFTISSLFPFYADSESSFHYFFPKSKITEMLPKESIDLHKEIKKIKWLDRDFFEKLISGESLIPYYFEEENGDYKLFRNVQGEYLTQTALPENKKIIKAQVFPRVTVSRTGTEDATPFYTERLFFHENAGLYFIAEGDHSLLEKSLDVLKEEGIGTDRNVGNGFFEWERGSMELKVPEKADYAVNLSLYLPTEKTVLEKQLDENAAYSFKIRGGWVSTPPYNTIRKNRIYMFEEGSVFRNNNDSTELIKGKIVNLKPDASKLPDNLKDMHDIWRNGKAIFIPFDLKN